MNNNQEKEPETRAEDQPEPEPKEPTIEDLLTELPLSDQQKKAVVALLGGLASNLSQINKRLETLETRGDSTAPELFEDLSPEQKYNILMAKYAAPAQAAQTGMLQSLLGAAGGGGGSSEIDQLLKSGERIKALRDAFTPEPTPLQIAMEKANIASVMAQTRLMNRVTGKQTDTVLDKLETELAGDTRE